MLFSLNFHCQVNQVNCDLINMLRNSRYQNFVAMSTLNKGDVRRKGRECCFEEWGSRSRAPMLPRKEVIQPQLPLQLPCYDFVPVTGPALGGRLLAVTFPTSGVTSSHDVTGGVYKARERIHRSVADLRLLATPTSCRRVAACNPN